MSTKINNTEYRKEIASHRGFSFPHGACGHTHVSNGTMVYEKPSTMHYSLSERQCELKFY